MDLVAAVRAFVSVSELGSCTDGAARARIPQSVASRRVHALEEHLGERLFDRSTRRPALTRFGREVLPSAVELLRSAERLTDAADRAQSDAVRVAVPSDWATRPALRLVAEARRLGLRRVRLIDLGSNRNLSHSGCQWTDLVSTTTVSDAHPG